MDVMPEFPVIMSVAFGDNKAFYECLRLASSLADPLLTSVRAAGIPRPSAPAVTEAVPLSTVLPVMVVAIWYVWAAYCPPASTESVPEPSPALESVPEPSPALESTPVPSSWPGVPFPVPMTLVSPPFPEVVDCTAEPPKVAASALAPPELAASAAKPSEEAASDFELSACSAMAKEAVYELSACPVLATKAVDNLSVLFFFFPVQPYPPWWFPAPSAPPRWSSAPLWKSCLVCSTLVVICSTVGVFNPT
ncbi:vegetative cell wall protein gp1-like [Cyprinus carpio]|uniref:Vegetative cell wall protein gp1-like n=1 Tax=Cyprinus carpio TaxID=7962 RepID=A0A9R0A9X9_CYPCA|nr:vegetative cell wall protein gp1-like [Cyprinus carpio]